jgi:hypothetical protein
MSPKLCLNGISKKVGLNDAGLKDAGLNDWA